MAPLGHDLNHKSAYLWLDSANGIIENYLVRTGTRGRLDKGIRRAPDKIVKWE